MAGSGGASMTEVIGASSGAPSIRRPGFISVVVPVRDEVGAIAEVHREITTALHDRPHEIVIVDDGSSDGTAEVLASLRPAVIVTLARGFGQTSALDAGIRVASGEIIVTLDGDGQNDPADIPMLVDVLAEGWDVVSGWRRRRQDPAMKRLSSRAAGVVRRALIDDGIHDSGCTLKAYRADCFDDLDLYGELHRFIPGILVWQGRRVTEREVAHRPRTTGRTKYDWRRGVKGFLDMLSVWFWRKYAQRPQHLFGGLGLLMLLAGFVLTGSLATLRLLGVIRLANSVLPLAGFFLLMSGTLLLIFGLVTDVLFRTHHRVHGVRPYFVRSISVQGPTEAVPRAAEPS
jgi:glycosyltransferase involved in cell wall biosynthesis